MKVTLSIVAIWLFGVAYTACVLAGSDGKCQLARNWLSQGVQTFVASITLCISLVVPLFILAFC